MVPDNKDNLSVQFAEENRKVRIERRELKGDENLIVKKIKRKKQEKKDER